ncbi:MAG: NAD-dependent epimerase/dehydratase family protein [Promethearchaeota archaeon]
MKILVTGATGFIGKAFIRTLIAEQRQYEIYCAVRKTSKKEDLEELDVKFVYFDLTDHTTFSHAVKGKDIVIHFAANYNFEASEESLFEQNVISTKKLAEACLEANVKHFVYCSSTEALGVVVNGIEESIYNPDEVYGRSKMEAEKILLDLQNEHNLPLTIVRPSGVYGPGDYYVFTEIIESMEKSIIKRIFPGSPKGTIHFTFIDDIVQGFVKIIDNPNKTIGEIFILASDKPQIWRELFEVIAVKLGNKPPRFIPHFPMIIARIFWPLIVKYYKRKGLGYPYVSIAIKKIQTSRNYANTKAKKILGFNPTVDYEFGVEKTVKWMREEGILNDRL